VRQVGAAHNMMDGGAQGSRVAIAARWGLDHRALSEDLFHAPFPRARRRDAQGDDRARGRALRRGSCLVRFGETHVLCAASLEDKPPPWLRGQGRGWVTAELRCCARDLDAHPARIHDWQSFRPHAGNPAADRPLAARRRRPAAPGERQITIDCDVLQADGGTPHRRDHRRVGRAQRLHQRMVQRSILKESPLKDHVAAVSCGIVKGEAALDLDYAEDSSAETDANLS